MSVLLSIENLKARVGENQILKGLNLKLNQGETVVLMGPNGSGKSTTAKVLAGHPAYRVSGSVKLAGEELLNLSPDERSKKGLFLAFQNPVEVPGVKILNFLWTIYTQKHPNRDKREHETIVDFKDYLEIKAKELDIESALLKRGLNENFSGGEKKRLEILQMLVIKPKVVILDEIDSGLDIDALKVVAKGVSQLQQETQLALIVITHYQRILQYIDYDQVNVVVDGKIVKSGGPELAMALEEQGYGEVRN